MAIIQTTINDLQNLSFTPNVTDVYYTFDPELEPGQEGFWRFDPGDTQSWDNIGTILVNSNPPYHRFKRIYDGYVNVKWFGARGDFYFYKGLATRDLFDFSIVTHQYEVFKPSDVGKFFLWPGAGITGSELRGYISQFIDSKTVRLSIPASQSSVEMLYWGSDDTEAIQAALDYVSDSGFTSVINRGGGTVFFPEGIYCITSTLYVGPFCTLLGITKGGNKVPGSNTIFSEDYTGSRLYCFFYEGLGTQNLIPKKQKWAIESSNYWAATGSRPELAETISIDDYHNGTITPTNGIVIENLDIFIGGYNKDSFELNDSDVVFGGIKLTSYYPVLRNVVITNARTGIMMTACDYGMLENVVVNALWYGVVITDSIEINLSNVSVEHGNVLYYGEEEIYNDEFYKYDGEELGDINKTIRTNKIDYGPPQVPPTGHELDLENSPTVMFGKTGIWILNCSEISLVGVVFEGYTNGLVCIGTPLSLTNCYTERCKRYGFVSAISWVNCNRIIIASSNDNFFFGAKFFGTFVNIYSFIYDNEELYKFVKPNLTSNRQVTFTNAYRKISENGVVLSHPNRVYLPDIIFLDETPNGANFGSIYINPDPLSDKYGDDLNYGFNENDALRSFDAALIRIQNQSTNNPIKVIYIKAAPVVNEGDDERSGAAIKNLDIVSIQNADILITTYDENVESNPPRLKGRIFFKGLSNETLQIGQIELLGNVNLYFRNIDLVCNNPNPVITPINANLSMFGLRNSYGRLTFESNNYSSPPYNIDLKQFYSLVQSNLSSLVVNCPISLLDIKFVNISINGGALSPIITGNPTLGIDCVRIASIRNGIGWQDAIIVRNNF
jgi:hypothetical protein